MYIYRYKSNIKMEEKEKNKKVDTLFSKLGELVKEHFSGQEPTQPVPVEMSDATLKDGTKVKVSGALAQGSKMLIVNADGSEIPAPTGEYILDDGSAVTVTDGIIDAVMPGSQVNDSKIGMEEKFATLQASYTDLETKYKTLLESSNGKFKEIEDLKNSFSKMQEVQKATYEVIEAIAGLPATEPVIESKPKLNFSKLEKIEAIANAMPKIKN